jgi:hypothetical protein
MVIGRLPAERIHLGDPRDSTDIRGRISGKCKAQVMSVGNGRLLALLDDSKTVVEDTLTSPRSDVLVWLDSAWHKPFRWMYSHDERHSLRTSEKDI